MMLKPITHYYLTVAGCSVGYALYLLVLMRAVRFAQGARRRLLTRVWVVSMFLYFPLGFGFRVVGWSRGLMHRVGTQAANPLLLAAAPLATAIWYLREYPGFRPPGPPTKEESAGEEARCSRSRPESPTNQVSSPPRSGNAEGWGSAHSSATSPTCRMPYTV